MLWREAKFMFKYGNSNPYYLYLKLNSIKIIKLPEKERSSFTRRSTIAQVLSPFFFVFLLYAISQALANQPNSIYDPQPLLAPPIPPCEDKFFITLPCFDFAWSGNDTALIVSIVHRIMNNNPARPIPPNKVKSFRTEEVDEWLYNNPTHCPGALHFAVRNKTVISYGVQTNSTQIAKRNQNEDPTFKFQIPLQIAADREIARTLIGASLNDPNEQAKLKSMLIQEVGPAIFLAIAMFGFVFQISSLVTEKELKLRQAMTMMGLYDTAYWLSWLTWETLFALFSSLLTYGNSLSSSLNFLSAYSGLDTWFPISDEDSSKPQYEILIADLLSLSPDTRLVLPSRCQLSFKDLFLFFADALRFNRAIELLAFATATAKSDGISWSKRSECSVPNCVITINGILIWFLATFCIWFVLALYLDSIIPNSSGVRKSIIYFLNPGYWTGKGGNKVEDGSIFSFLNSVPQVENKTPDDEDVFEEENTVKQQAKEGIVDPNVAVQIRGLVKTYPGKIEIGCCKLTRKSHFHAVKFDILWDILTGEEHLHLFASIKGLPDSSIKLVAQKSLAEVRLTEAAQRRAGSYSGGMKRRLSVAIALIGDPNMDPITRRHVWDIIENAKKGRAIILTTHSMEEADILSDRIRIVAKEEAIAKTLHEALKKFFKHHLNVVPKEETNYFLSYVIANEKEHLLTVSIHDLIRTIRYEFQAKMLIKTGIQLGLTTLEEVFLNVASKAALETATVENNLILVGVKHIGIPRTESPLNPRELMVEIYWGHDSNGNLCIIGHSDETPIPDKIHNTVLPSPPTRLGHEGPVHGIVLNL
ncbi:hypothetical protein TEA_002782 [Camellia sinensis var. sinensis]|uniref:ABC-2 type transporter transmembrane domain-containing protein n=1 Tax=Camellia sinensis var. sinensis TaxID=542762 RepID=A0A4S4D0M5_CAMSN|nr:hypothetical protein TEA_002782 [Camellia sinensis var. sinensis]